jgi:hypothetical protein
MAQAFQHFDDAPAPTPVARNDRARLVVGGAQPLR